MDEAWITEFHSSQKCSRRNEEEDVSHKGNEVNQEFFPEDEIHQQVDTNIENHVGDKGSQIGRLLRSRIRL